MAKAEQILVLDPPSELHFKGPFTDVVTVYLKLTNPSERRVCYKVKTTAPKKYCVRPNSDILEAKETGKVSVMLQPFDYNPNEKTKHKFMVQTMFIPEGEVDLDSLWRDAKPESLMDSKLRCVFDMPSEGVATNNIETNAVPAEEKTHVAKSVSETTVKVSPKVKITNTESEVKMIVEENKRLRDEMHQLRVENAQLMEEGVRQRTRGAMSGDSGGRATTSQHTTNPVSQKELLQQSYAFRVSEQPQSPMLYLAVILTIGLLGIFIGKFIV